MMLADVLTLPPSLLRTLVLLSTLLLSYSGAVSVAQVPMVANSACRCVR